MYEDSLKELKEAKVELEKVSKELGFDIFSLLGSKRVSLNETFPSLLEERKDLSREDVLRLFKVFFNFQRLTLICLDRVILNSLNESIKTTFEKKRELENELWKNYFQKLMGD